MIDSDLVRRLLDDGLSRFHACELRREAASALEAQAKEIEALRAALERIEGGRYPGITNLVLAGAWQEVVNTMQADARTALKG